MFFSRNFHTFSATFRNPRTFSSTMILVDCAVAPIPILYENQLVMLCGFWINIWSQDLLAWLPASVWYRQKVAWSSGLVGIPFHQDTSKVYKGSQPGRLTPKNQWNGKPSMDEQMEHHRKKQINPNQVLKTGWIPQINPSQETLSTSFELSCFITDSVNLWWPAYGLSTPYMINWWSLSFSYSIMARHCLAPMFSSKNFLFWGWISDAALSQSEHKSKT